MNEAKSSEGCNSCFFPYRNHGGTKPPETGGAKSDKRFYIKEISKPLCRVSYLCCDEPYNLQFFNLGVQSYEFR